MSLEKTLQRPKADAALGINSFRRGGGFRVTASASPFITCTVTRHFSVE
jgi:hypothetical protein